MKIHLNSRNGMYTVVNYNDTYITLTTAKYYAFQVPCSDFKCFAGGNFNSGITKEEQDLFLATVNPSMFAHQEKMTQNVLETIKALQTESTVKDEIDIHLETHDYNHDTEEELKRAQRELIALKDKALEDAREVYRYTIPHNEFKLIRPIKFIIQENVLDGTLRFKYDPYEFVDSYHSALSNLFREADWSTINGGWLQQIKGKIILFGKSGDYGVYDDTIATELASKLFTEKFVFSHAGQEMLDISHLYDDMPF
jgi:hypothetical protein